MSRAALLAELTKEIDTRGARRIGVDGVDGAGKTWLADEPTDTYGGVYTWNDRQAMEAFADTELFKGFVADPHFIDITARDFAVLDGPTAVTHRHAALAA